MEKLQKLKDLLLQLSNPLKPFTDDFGALAAVNSEINKQIEILKDKENEKSK